LNLFISAHAAADCDLINVDIRQNENYKLTRIVIWNPVGCPTAWQAHFPVSRAEARARGTGTGVTESDPTAFLSLNLK